MELDHRLAMNNLTMKIKVQILIIEALKLCYGFLKLSCYIKESELEFDKTLKGIVFPRRRGSCMPKFPQRVEKRLDCSLLALYLSYASGFCCYFWTARRIYLTFTLFVFWQAYRVCLGLVLSFLWSIADQPSWGTGCRKMQWYTYISTHPQLRWRLQLMDELLGAA